MLQTQTRSLLEQLADQKRSNMSDWRALILLRRATAHLPASRRRWREAPQQVAGVHRLLQEMVARGDLTPAPRLSRII